MVAILVVAGTILGMLGVTAAVRVPGLLGDRRAIGLAAAVAATAAAFADARPTGHPVVDAVLCATFAGLLAIAGQRATPAASVIAAGLVTAATAGAGVMVGFAALGAATATTRRSDAQRFRAVGAVAGGVVANLGLRLEWPASIGGPAVVAVLASGLICLSGFRHAHSAWRRRLATACVAFALLVFVFAAIAVLPLWSARADADAALAAGVAAISAARAGDSEAAVGHFERTTELLAGVRRATNHWWVRPARVIPVVAQNLDAVTALLEAAEDLTTVGSETIRDVDVERARPRDGRIDVEALASFETPLTRSATVLASVDRRLGTIERRWLAAGLLYRIDDVRRRVVGAMRDNDVALDATRNIPALLGAGGQQRWFLAVVTPSELRGGGGLMGSWGILTATDGKLELPQFERVEALYRDEPYRIHVDDEWDARYIQRWKLAKYPQNLLVSPHLPSSAEAIRQMAEQAGLGAVDGVIVVDPFALAELLKLTGPINVDGWPEALTPENAAEILLYRQYLDPDAPGRLAFLANTTRTVFDALTTGDLAPTPEIASVLGPMVGRSRLQLFAFDQEHGAYLDRIGAVPRLDPPIGDAVAVISSNAAATKLDWFLRRRVDYDVLVDQDGHATAIVEVRLRNLAPPDIPGSYFFSEPSGLDRGESRQLVSLYTRLRVAALTVDGVSVEPQPSVERGHHVVDVFVNLPSQGVAVLRYRLEGDLPMSTTYSLDLGRQPTIAADEGAVTVNGEQHRVDALTEPLTLTIRLPDR